MFFASFIAIQHCFCYIVSLDFSSEFSAEVIKALHCVVPEQKYVFWSGLIAICKSFFWDKNIKKQNQFVLEIIAQNNLISFWWCALVSFHYVLRFFVIFYDFCDFVFFK